MNTNLRMMTALLLMVCTAACAQMPPGQPEGNPAPGMGPGMAPNMDAMRNPGPPRQGGDPMMEVFFPPELIMQNQKAIGLKEDQQTAIREGMQKAMARFTDLQWQQSAEAETMASLVKQERPDEKLVLAQLDKLMSIENQIKRLHLTMLIKLKNMLTPEQQAKLHELKPRMGPPPGAGGMQGPSGRSPGGEGPRGQSRPAPRPPE